SSFAFRVVSGPLIFTAISVVNALRRSAPGSAPFPTVSPLYSVPELRYQVHTVLQFVPAHVDVRVCNFSERIERGLLLAYGEGADGRRRAETSASSALQVAAARLKLSVDITFAVRDGRGYLLGSDVSEHLRKLSLVEFSFYLGFPVLQIAEPLHYPELNTSHHLRSTWVRTGRAAGVQQAALAESHGGGQPQPAGRGGRWSPHLWQHFWFCSPLWTCRWRGWPCWAEQSGPWRSFISWRVRGGSASRRRPPPPPSTAWTRRGPPSSWDTESGSPWPSVSPEQNRHRATGAPADHSSVTCAAAETAPVPPAETHSSSIWLIVGVIVPILLALFIVVILYWKLCGSEKLEFQPDAVNAVQQRQKLQAPSVKGFDFAKLHLGQHSKDDMLVIQEPGPLPAPAKEATPSDAGDLNTPKSKSSSNKGARSGRRRGRLSPSDGDSLGSDQSSARESAEESARAVATPTEGKQHRRTPRNGSTPDEFLSSTSIFDHVDRLSRGSADGLRRQGNKVQLIAMQPQPSPPHAASQPSPSLTEKVSGEAAAAEGWAAGVEPGPAVVLQVALRHKSEIEHHRNKLRQRAKRRGQCEFPSMDDIMDAFGDGPVQGEAAQRLYSSAHDHMDCMVPSDGPSPTDSRRRSPCRGRSSPRGRRAQPGLGSLPDTDRDRDRDRLLAEQSATYRKYPGLNNVAYMSDPDLPPDRSSPSPSDESLTPRPPRRPTRPPGPPSRRRGSSMHSLLDDAFALVSPSSQGSAGVSGVSPALPSPVPQARPPGRQWGSYPAVPAHSPFSSSHGPSSPTPAEVRGAGNVPHVRPGSAAKVRDHQLTLTGTCAGSRQALTSGGLVATGDQLQESLYPSRGQYEDAPCPSRPPPVGGSTSVHFQQLTQVGLSSQMGAYPVVGRSMSGPTGSSWNQPHPDQDQNPPRASRESDSAAPPLLLSSPAPDSPPEDASPSAHSSASLIKAIREELQRLAHKQAAVTSYP
ncbi:unnamed protein product, partial [Tetraodon nigroviridis]